MSKVEASRTTGKETVHPNKSCQMKDLFLTTKENRTDNNKDVYGHIDQMDGCYNILKLKVLDAKDDVNVSKSCPTYQNKNYYMEAKDNVSATTSTASNSNADEIMSKTLLKREQMKHQKDLFFTLNSFKHKDTNKRKMLRYSFVKPTELI